MYLIYALISSIFASLTAIFIKLGLSNINSNLATAIRTIIILIISWIIVFYTNSFENIKSIDSKNLIFLIVSGITTGLSWIFYFKAVWNRNFTAFNFWCNRSLFTYYVYE